VIVLSHDAFNNVPTWRSVIVVPVSSSLRQAGRGPTAVSLAAGVGGLERDGVAVCHQVTTLDRGKLAEVPFSKRTHQDSSRAEVFEFLGFTSIGGAQDASFPRKTSRVRHDRWASATSRTSSCRR
jgi:hypothetical protein